MNQKQEKNVIVVIPVRMNSSRFPGKPLTPICGLPMLSYCIKNANNSSLANDVYVATCDGEIMDYVKSIGEKVVMTKDTHERATERTAECLGKVEILTGKKVDIVVMLQGDEPLITGAMIDEAIGSLQREDEETSVVNLMSKITEKSEFYDPNTIKVVFDEKMDAIYFSRSPIPYQQDKNYLGQAYKQVCALGFTRKSLLDFINFSPSHLEKVECIDMLRYLEKNRRVRMVLTKGTVQSVDIPDDVRKVERILEK